MNGGADPSWLPEKGRRPMDRWFDCEGWWEQTLLGRQTMDHLQISWKDGKLLGSGHDCVGLFSLDGALTNDGLIDMTKSYAGKHRVRYVGTYDGEGLMQGTWRLTGQQGPWVIRLRRHRSNQETEIAEMHPQQQAAGS